jgi:hypothetical protein
MPHDPRNLLAAGMVPRLATPMPLSMLDLGHRVRRWLGPTREALGPGTGQNHAASAVPRGDAQNAAAGPISAPLIGIACRFGALQLKIVSLTPRAGEMGVK